MSQKVIRKLTDVKLQYALDINGASVDVIKLRRPTVADMEQIEVMGNDGYSNMAVARTLISNLSNGMLTPDDVSLMDPDDFAKVSTPINEVMDTMGK